MNVHLVANPFAASGEESIIYKDETVSTMNDALILAQRGLFGAVAVAGYQSEGRGRTSHRRWICPPGEGLLFTLVLGIGQPHGLPQFIDPTVVRLETLPLRAGIALSRVLEQHYSLRPQIKWPNDVLLEGKKCAGILCEAYSGFALVAMGINVGQHSVPPPEQQRTPAISLSARLPSIPSLEELLSQLLAGIADALVEPLWQHELESRLYRREERVRFLPGADGTDPLVEGTLVGVDERGCLVIEVEPEGARRVFTSGEIRA